VRGDYKVIAIGAGPAGIAVGVECIASGISASDVLILEKGEHCVDAIRKFYPDKKMTLANYKGLPTVTHGSLSVFPDLTKPQTLSYFEDLIGKNNLQVRYKADAYKVTSDSGKLKVFVGQEVLTAQIICIGIGILGRPNKPSYKIPTSLRSKVLFDITSEKIEGKKILIVGGGDTSSEYCQVLSEERNEITMVVRGQDLSRMMESNQKALLKLSDSKKVRLCMGVETLGIEDQEGNPRVLFKDESKMPAETFDRVVFAIGGTTPINFLRTAGVNCEKDWPLYSDTGATNIPNLYLVGDLVAGKTGGSIITAYNSAFRAVSEFKTKIL